MAPVNTSAWLECFGTRKQGVCFCCKHKLLFGTERYVFWIKPLELADSQIENLRPICKKCSELIAGNSIQDYRKTNEYFNVGERLRSSLEMHNYLCSFRNDLLKDLCRKFGISNISSLKNKAGFVDYLTQYTDEEINRRLEKHLRR